jgi:hypothetical protein
MTNPTSNFGWQMPTSTDLVTDLPADFETFGQAVDTSMADLKGGTTGQILSKASNTDMDFTWVANDVGDITAVTAGTGITGGGTSGAVTVSFDQANFGGGQFAAGKNHIINGDFYINQRAFTSTTVAAYGFDRWAYNSSGSTATYSAQTFSPGTAPVAGYEGANFARLAVTVGNDFACLRHPIEDVRTFAGQTVTLSFWAKGTNPATLGSLGARLEQHFGTATGGSPLVIVPEQSFVLTANWQRYSLTYSVPSISGKTIGTANTFLNLIIGQMSNTSTDSWTMDIWGVQLEAGSVATPFQTASGTIAGELLLCQRYYQRVTAGGAYGTVTLTGNANSTTAARTFFPQIGVRRFPATSTLEYANVILNDGANLIAAGTITLGGDGASVQSLTCTTTGLTQFRPYVLTGDNNAAGYVAISWEL